MKILNRILDRIDDKRKKKHLANWPYQYVDRNGRKWFNTTYRNGYGQLRKWC